MAVGKNYELQLNRTAIHIPKECKNNSFLIIHTSCFAFNVKDERYILLTQTCAAASAFK
jgi:azurin